VAALDDVNIEDAIAQQAVPAGAPATTGPDEEVEADAEETEAEEEEPEEEEEEEGPSGQGLGELFG
jgi:large subunit ribosomal protein L12